MAKDVFGAARRRNVSPKSSTLHVQTRDVDCSGLALAPEDGEFVLLTGDKPSTGVLFHGAANAVDATEVEGSLIRMVWSSARRSDRAALGDKRVPVFAHGPGIDLDIKLYGVAADNALTQSGNFPAGTLLSIGETENALDAVAGTGRWVLEAMLADECGWCVGYVREVVSGNCGNDAAIKIHLYGTPRFVGAAS